MVEDDSGGAWLTMMATGAITAAAVSRRPHPERAWSTTSTRSDPRAQASSIVAVPVARVMSVARTSVELSRARSSVGAAMAARSPRRSQVSRSRRMTGQEVKPGESSGGR